MKTEIVDLPVAGTVFIASARPFNPLIVLKEDEDHPGDICRLDIHGVRAIWGNWEDWKDELRRGTIRVVYTPGRF